MILIGGSARSGTHMLGRVLEVGGFDVRFEEEPLFSMFTEYALSGNRALFEELSLQLRQSKDVVLKDHPSIWFPLHKTEAKMLVIRRNAPDTIASMMKHGGVLSWFAKWREYPLPNRFLGITRDLAPRYDDLPLEVKCFLRWQSHWERSEDLRAQGVFIIDFEEFEADAEKAALKVYSYLDVPMPPLSFHWKGRTLKVARSKFLE